MATSILRIETEDPELIENLIEYLLVSKFSEMYDIDTNFDVSATGSTKIRMNFKDDISEIL